MATAWKYTCQVVYASTLLVHQKLLLATSGCKPLGSLWIRDAFYFPEPFPTVENLSARRTDRVVSGTDQPKLPRQTDEQGAVAKSEIRRSRT